MGCGRRHSYSGYHGDAPIRHATEAHPLQELFMLHYAVVFFVIALIAALFGFGGIAAGAASIAQVLFFVFVVLAVISFIFGLVRRGR
jgi:uncharacterized membrane protein YtjA (UPF0391 family)